MSRITGVALSSAQIIDVLSPGGTADIGEFGGLLDGSGIDFVLLQSDSAPRFDPSIAATLLARHTISVGLVVAAAPLRDHPYNLARRLGSLDHVSGGRVGWLILPEDIAAPNGSVWSGGNRTDVLVDTVQVARKLWESWPSDTIVGDHETGVFAESERIVHIDHEGAHRVAGPLNLPEPPQSHLPVFWESSRWPDTDRIAAVADVVIGSASAHAGQKLLVPWRIGSAEPSIIGDGILIHGDGTAGDVIAVGASHAGPPRNPSMLRHRLGLSAPAPALQGALRSAFPLS